MSSEIEVFQDLTLSGPAADRTAFKEALISAATGDWSVDLERSKAIKQSIGIKEDVVLFRCKKSSTHPDAGLTLWGTEDGFYVPNIVPLAVGQLTYQEYNSVLNRFIDEIIAPIIDNFEYKIQTTKPAQTLTDWVSKQTEECLLRFSKCANKSSGASHPLDERRWYDFILSTHRNKENLGPDRLSRWLIEVEHWDDETAHNLAGKYEQAISLLKYYDEN